MNPSTTTTFSSSHSEQGTNNKKRKVPTHNHISSYQLNLSQKPPHPVHSCIPLSSSTSNYHHPITLAPPIDHLPLSSELAQTQLVQQTLPFRFHRFHLDPLPSPDSPIDSSALARILSSHHVKMRIKPISSPRHYGRHLHKLALSRTLDSKPISEHSTTTSINPSKSTTSSPTKPTPTTQKVGKKKLYPSPQRPQSKRISKRQVPSPFNSKYKSPSALIKSKNIQLLKPPILPNLYDPTLKIDQIPTATTSLFSPSTSSSTTNIFRSSTSNCHSTLDKSQPSQNKITFADGYDGEFRFKLEMAEISQRLSGLHLAISVDKRNRAAQIQEAMKIAMEKVDRSSIGGPGGGSDQSALLQSLDHQSLINSEDDHFLELGNSTREASDQLINHRNHRLLDPVQTANINSAAWKSRFLSTHDPDGGFSTDHGPSGPPPSEPPPPLPHQPPIKANKSIGNVSCVQASTTETEDNKLQPPKRNQQQKGKKKRSAHANANNIHHRDNYVPSRLPNSYQFNSFSGSSNDLLNNSTKNSSGRNNNEWSAFDFLSHDQFEDSSGGSNEFVFIDPNLSLLLGPTIGTTGSNHTTKKKSEQEFNKKRHGGAAAATTTGVQPHCQLGRSPISKFFVEPDEWICSFCEYQLWFGDEISLIKVIKNRKQVLRRRRRAKERAANGINNIKSVNNNPQQQQPNHNNNGTTDANTNSSNNNKDSPLNLKDSTPLIPDDHGEQKKKKKKKIIELKSGKKHKVETKGINPNPSEEPEGDEHAHYDQEEDDDDGSSKSSGDRFDDQSENYNDEDHDHLDYLFPTPSSLALPHKPNLLSLPLPTPHSSSSPNVPKLPSRS